MHTQHKTHWTKKTLIKPVGPARGRVGLCGAMCDSDDGERWSRIAYGMAMPPNGRDRWSQKVVAQDE